MNISQILTLPDGVSGIDCQGIATYVQPAQNKTGTTDGRDWSFWTQGVVIKDGTGEIWVNLNLGEESYLAVPKGKRISVEKGVIGSYNKTDKDGNSVLRKSLKARLVVAGAPLQGQQAPQQPHQAANIPQAGQLDPEKATRLSIERQTSIKAACEFYASCTEATDEAVLEFARKAAYFIATGLSLADKEQTDRELKEAEAALVEEPLRHQEEPDAPESGQDDDPAF